MINWTLGVYPIKSLKNHPKNPRQLSKDQNEHLKTSIGKFGLIEKPIINRDLTVIGGHQRIRVLKAKGAKTVECWIPDRLLDEKEVDELCIRLNRNTGDWDFDLLANEFEAMDLLEWGFSEEQLVGSFSEVEGEKPEKKKKSKECPNCGHPL